MVRPIPSSNNIMNNNQQPTASNITASTFTQELFDTMLHNYGVRIVDVENELHHLDELMDEVDQLLEALLRLSADLDAAGVV